MTTRGEPPRKRVKTDASRASTGFANGDAVREALQNSNPDELAHALVTLRNQLTVRPHEEPIAPSDARLALLQSYLDSPISRDAKQLFDAWSSTSSKQPQHLATAVSALAAVLNLLSSHYTFHALGQPIVKNLLSSPWIHHLKTYLSSSSNELVIASLKCFLAVSSFAGGREQRVLMDAFAWESKSLHKLLSMRRRTNAKSTDVPDPLAQPDIRTLYILFHLSFLSSTSPAAVKLALLSGHREQFVALFKGLPQDPPVVVSRLLEACWTGIWGDARVPRAVKVGVFGEATLGHITKLYDRAQVEDDSDHTPAELAHHFLLALCTRPGTGICFRDRGWYPRDTPTSDSVAQPSHDVADEDDMVVQEGGKGQIHNRILSHLLKSLRAADDARQRELALRILAACPELVAGYAWPALEPRLSSRWLSNIAFLREAVGLPVPLETFHLQSSSHTAATSSSLQDQVQYNPVPPPLAVLLANALPTAQLKTHLSKGLQAQAPLVQHASALALARCLEKYAHIRDALGRVSEALGEDLETGNWARRRREFESGARRRVPEFSVIVAFAQGVGKVDSSDNKGEAKDEAGDGKSTKRKEVNPTRDALLSESAARLLWLYHRALPQLIAETRFDAGKLMARLISPEHAEDDTEAGGLAVLTQLHTLRLLQETDGFVWSGKIGGRSHLHTLLTLYTTTPTQALRTASESLLSKLLTESILFQHSSGGDEVHAWLSALPTRGRAEGAVAADGTPLTDERTAVLVFLDDCVQRCLKTSYKYMDELAAMLTSGDGDEDGPSAGEGEDERLSPLFATVLEQLRAKITGALLSPSDMLALASFARRLVYSLAAQGRNLHTLARIGARIESVFEDGAVVDGTALGVAMKREAKMTARCAELVGRARSADDNEMGEDEEQTIAVRHFLDTVEQLPPTDVDAGELVDWLRLLRSPLPSPELARVVRFIVARAPVGSAMLQEMWESVPIDRSPLSSEAFWKVVGEVDGGTAPFSALFLHASADQLGDKSYRTRMVASALRQGTGTVLNFICQRLGAQSRDTGTEGERADLVLLLAEISASLPGSEREQWKLELYKAEGLRVLLSGVPGTRIREALAELLRSTLNPRSMTDTELVSPFTSACVARGTLDDMTPVLAPYMRGDEARSILHMLVRAASTDNARALLCVLVRTLRRSLDSNVDAQTRNDLITLHIRYPDLDIVEQVIASAVAACVPLGLSGSHNADLDLEDFQSIGAVVTLAEKRWTNRLDTQDWAQGAEVFLRRDTTSWTDDTVTALESMAYVDSGARDAIGHFLASARAEDLETDHLATLVHAWLDAANENPAIDDPRAISHFTRILTLTSDASSTLVLMTARFPALHEQFTQAVVFRLGAMSKKALPANLVFFAERWCAATPDVAEDVCAAVLDHGLRWAAHALAASGAVDVSVLDALGRLGLFVPVKGLLLDVVLAAVVQNRLDDACALDFVEVLMPRAQMKPVIVNRHLQSIVQHADFYRHVAVSSSSRCSLIHLIHTLFHLHPANTCQPSHIQPLILAYSGSQGQSDRWIFDIFRLYEETRKVSVAPLFARWSIADGSVGTAIQTVLNLDASQVYRSCLALPTRAKETVFSAEQGGHPFTADQVYEPRFVVSLLAQALAGEMPRSVLEWVAFFRTNAVSLAVRCLSSEDADLRRLALGCLATLRTRMDAVDMQEGPQTVYILDLLKDTVKQDSNAETCARVPAFTTLLLAHSLRAVFFPANFIYPITSRFLLQRPEVDTSDVPMLYSMLHSGSDEWKRERAWMLKFLADAMLGAGAAEWEIFRRRRTWDLLASLWQNDRAVRTGILDTLVNLTASRHIVTGLVLKSALLAWMEMVLLTPQGELTRLWLAVLENILMVADTAKLEAATGGEWRAAVSRCLGSLIEQQGSNLGLLDLESRVLLRLSQLPGPPPPNLPGLVSHCVDKLAILEPKIAFESPAEPPRPDGQPVALLHSSLDSQSEDKRPDVSRWCDIVSALWRVAIALRSDCQAWGRLTPRLLLRRTLVSSHDDKTEGEWARQQVMFHLGTN
ncbi:hypothetical protein PENSPDRAFT_627099 [Peniophora sp. CONT]|nr:hypothetical protein PENSPDRAFT_627099 [Peniophora sp. CONT]